MKSTWVSKVLLILAGIFWGLVLGIIISAHYQKMLAKTTYDKMSLAYRAWEGEKAASAYMSARPEIAHYALIQYLEILEYFYNNTDKDSFPEATAQDLAFTYVRLGNVAKSEGNSKLSEDYFNKGLGIYVKYKKSIGKETSLQSLLSLVNKLDASYKPRNIKFTDAVLGNSTSINK